MEQSPFERKRRHLLAEMNVVPYIDVMLVHGKPKNKSAGSCNNPAPPPAKADNKLAINEIINKINSSVADTKAFLFYNSVIITILWQLAFNL